MKLLNFYNVRYLDSYSITPKFFLSSNYKKIIFWSHKKEKQASFLIKKLTYGMKYLSCVACDTRHLRLLLILFNFSDDAFLSNLARNRIIYIRSPARKILWNILLCRFVVDALQYSKLVVVSKIISYTILRCEIVASINAGNYL